MISIPHAGKGVWTAYSRGQHPNGPFSLYFYGRRRKVDIPGLKLQNLEEAELTCAILNYAYDCGVEFTKNNIRNTLGL